MSSRIDELVVPYDPTPALSRAERWRRLLRRRLVSLGISVILLALIFFWQRDRLTANWAGTVVVYAVVLLAGCAWALFCWIAMRRSRRAAAGAGQGVALRVDRSGIELADRRIGWTQLATLTTAKGSWPSGPLLRAVATDGSQVDLPLEQLQVLPATLDSTVRAYSGGRHGLDLSALDI
ncbi:hypothetical protein [Microlunatus sp. Gsoil 973]|uniref:hypothetical protein n=1 Tax=Microlunatus sp. Gsoil 973 TaxID=2672569 RepID=UPI0012B45F31|nr:hypothetical protein [Microlunatus sp. Gsoil 973]QGN34755.1 hypothetical protein GJV80_20165 [Microlunatus sp. Gsoil 973]